MSCALAPVAVAAVCFGLTGCGEATSSAAGIAHSTPALEPWQFEPGEKARCSDRAVVSRIAAAKATTVELVENGVMSPPDEVRSLGGTPAQIAEEFEAWKKLSPADRLFQLCFAVDQGFSRD